MSILLRLFLVVCINSFKSIELNNYWTLKLSFYLLNLFHLVDFFHCSIVPSNTSKGNLEKHQLAQNFGARVVLGFGKFDYISQGLKSLNWLSVCDMLYLRDAIMVFKCINNLVPDYHHEF